jgi:hypothetical protein
VVDQPRSEARLSVARSHLSDCPFTNRDWSVARITDCVLHRGRGSGLAGFARAATQCPTGHDLRYPSCRGDRRPNPPHTGSRLVFRGERHSTTTLRAYGARLRVGSRGVQWSPTRSPGPNLGIEDRPARSRRVKNWLSGIADAIDLFLSGPQARQTGQVRDGRGGGANARAMWSEWRAMRLPREFSQGGLSDIVGGIGVAKLIDDAMLFLDPCFKGEIPPGAAQQRDALLDRFDRVIPELKGGSRGYVAMGREVLRRAPVE